MSEDGEMWRSWKAAHKALKAKYGVPCPKCPTNRSPTILMPQQTCKVDGYRDPRPRLTRQQNDEVFAAHGWTRGPRSG